MKKNIVEKVLEIANNKNIQIPSGQLGRLNNLERDYKNGKIDTNKVIEKLQNEFSYHFDKYDYREIEKEISG